MRCYTLLCILFLFSSLQGQVSSISLLVSDSSLHTDTNITIEIVESGALQKGSLNTEIRCAVPLDTIWNVCVSNRYIEKCYEILEKDLSVNKSFEITNSMIPILTTLLEPITPKELILIVDSGIAQSESVPTVDTNDVLVDNASDSNQVFGLQQADSNTIIHDTTGIVNASPVQPETNNFRAPNRIVDSLALAQRIDSLKVKIEKWEDEGRSEKETVRLRKSVMLLQKKLQRAPATTTLSTKDIKNSPGMFLDDLILVLGSQPGVSTSSDFTSKLNVRGSASDENLMLLDKGIIYTPFHCFGLFSSFITNTVDSVDFYTGGFPVEYGDRLASVIDVHSAVGARDTTAMLNGGFRINVFAGEAHLKGSIGKVHWLIAARKSYLTLAIDLTRKMKLHEEELEYGFYDLQGKLKYDISEGHTVEATVYQGRDSLTNRWMNIGWGNHLTALNHSLKTKGLQWQNHLSYSSYNHRIDRNYVADPEYINSRSEHDVVANSIKTIKMVSNVASKKRSGLVWGAGIEHLMSQFRFDRDSDKEFRYNGKIDSTTSIYERFYHSRSPMYTAPYGSVGYKNRWIKPEFGIRSTYHFELQKPYFEPRLNIMITPAKKHAIQLQLGHYYQFVNSLHFHDYISVAMDNYFPAQVDDSLVVPPARELFISLQYTARDLLQSVDFHFGGFYKSIWDTYLFDVSQVPIKYGLDSTRSMTEYMYFAEGYAYGFESVVALKKKPITGEMSYSYNKTILMNDLLNYAYYAAWDRTHSLKMNLGFQWRGRYGFITIGSKGLFLRTSLQWKYTSGSPYTELNGYEYVPTIMDNEKSQILSFGLKNQKPFPNYSRVDVKIIEVGRAGQWRFSFSIINLFNTKNLFMKSHDYFSEPPVIEEIYQMPIIPMFLDFEWNF